MNSMHANEVREEKTYLRLEKPVPFKGTLNGDITTSVELAKVINKLFSSAFKDYEGCTLGLNQFGQFNCALYFKDKGNGDIIPLAVSTRGRNSSPADRIKAMNLRNKNKTYTISDTLRDVLEQFVNVQGGRNAKPNIDAKLTEVMEQAYGSAGFIYVMIDDININKILKTIYGSKDEESRYDYNVTVIKPVGPMGGTNQNYIIKVDQLDITKVEQLAAKVGLVPTVGTIPMIREY